MLYLSCFAKYAVLALGKFTEKAVCSPAVSDSAIFSLLQSGPARPVARGLCVTQAPISEALVRDDILHSHCPEILKNA